MCILKNIIVIKSNANLKWLTKKCFSKIYFINFSRFAAIAGVGDQKFTGRVVRIDTKRLIENGH